MQAAQLSLPEGVLSELDAIRQVRGEH
jgi:hypothetical protein